MNSPVTSKKQEEWSHLQHNLSEQRERQAQNFSKIPQNVLLLSLGIRVRKTKDCKHTHKKILR